MATLSSLVETIARVEGIDPLQVGWIARQLREADLIRKGGRGRGGARMTPEDAANLVIAVNAASSPKEAVAVVGVYRSLTWQPELFGRDQEWEALREDPFKSVFRGWVSAGEAIEKLILMAVPVFKPLSELEEALDRESLDIEIEFVRPLQSIGIKIHRYDPPQNEEDSGEYYAAEVGSFVSLDPATAPESDRSDRVRITHKTILEVGKALAS